jgi:hypothetical protein
MTPVENSVSPEVLQCHVGVMQLAEKRAKKRPREGEPVLPQLEMEKAFIR